MESREPFFWLNHAGQVAEIGVPVDIRVQEALFLPRRGARPMLFASLQALLEKLPAWSVDDLSSD
jgi:hypothetical protein